MKKRTKITAIILTVAMLFSLNTSVLAADEVPADNSKIIAATNFVNGILNGAFKFLNMFFAFNDMPTVEEYYASDSENFYEGTKDFIDVPSKTAQWKLGFGKESIVPDSLKNGEKEFYTGGYFTQKVNSVYDDQGVNAIALNDSSGRGTAIFASVDGIGVCNSDVRTIRATVEKMLKDKGIKSDIIAININATHCHTVTDTQGFGLSIIPALFYNMLPFVKPVRSIDKEFYDYLINGTASAIVEAYENMEAGKLYYFETATIGRDEEKGVYLDDEYAYLTNKRYKTEGYQNFIACFKFIPDNEESKPTVFSNLGAHPTTIDRSTERLSADFPHYIEQVVNENGMNFVFLQGAQSPISVRRGDAQNEDTVNRVNAEIAASPESSDYRSAKMLGYDFARLILEASEKCKEVEPILNVKMAECTVNLDNGLMQLGATSELLGMTTVKDKSSQSGYSIITEVGYIELGTDIVMLSVPGELIPQLVYGNVVTAKDAYLGTDWTIPTAKELIGNDKTILVMGLTNDAIGYIVPDNDYAPFIADSLWNSDIGEKLYGPAHRHYEEMLSCGSATGSSIMTAVNELIESEK